MKKKLLMAAVGAALCAGPVVAAHAAGATLYGHMHMSLDRLDNDGDTAIPGDVEERGFLSSNSVRFGIKGDEDLGGGLKAIYQIESGGLAADTGTNGMGNRLRNTFVGFNGGWGTVKLGRHDTPFKDIGRKIDNFNEQVGDARNIIGSGDGLFNWDLRTNNMIRYESPSFGGLQVNYLYGTAEGQAFGSASGTNNDINSLAVNWTGGPLWAAFGYETHKTTTDENETGMRLSGSYTMNDFTVGLFWEDLSDIEGVSSLDLTTMGLFASMKMGNNKFKFHWFEADDLDTPFGTAQSTGGSLFAIGVDHTFSKTAMVYLNYAQAENDDNASFVNVTSGNGGHGDAVGLSGSGGSSPTGISAGMILKF
jgi:predicted porin